MMRYRHEVGIVQMLGACLRRPHVVIVYELMTCNLHDRIHSPALPRLTKRQTMKILLQVAEGLSSLHPRVVHRDLKVRTLFLELLPPQGWGFCFAVFPVSARENGRRRWEGKGV